jgi:1,4-dihydroxy-2-naphthoate octaprenyltransferase
MSFYAWVRIIRIRFLLASVIAVSAGLAVAWWQNATIDVYDAIITMCGILALHASVDLLNDYWDFKRGIDTKTKRTKMSGGTGVLPEGLLEPSKVYRAGIISLIIGSIIGVYFVVVDGWILAMLLGFAVISIYFYSTKIVDSGLAEIFVTIKGICIVLGTYYIQTNELSLYSAVMFTGVMIGVLSSLVLFVTSFPDYEADKSKGRKTLVIIMGKKKASSVFWVFPIVVYGVVSFGVSMDVMPVFTLLVFCTMPFMIWSGVRLRKKYDDDIKGLEPIMEKTLMFSRITGALLVLGFVLG